MNIINYLVCGYKKTQIYLIILCVLFLISFICGIFFCENLSGGFIYINLTEYNIFFDLSIPLGSYFISKLFTWLGIITFITISGLIVYSIALHCIIICYLGIILGCIVVTLCGSYSLSGVIIVLIVVLPSYLLRIASLISLSSLNYLSVIKSNKCGKLNLSQIGVNFIVSFLVILLALIWELVLLGIIIRPSNILF